MCQSEKLRTLYSEPDLVRLRPMDRSPSHSSLTGVRSGRSWPLSLVVRSVGRMLRSRGVAGTGDYALGRSTTTTWVPITLTIWRQGRRGGCEIQHTMPKDAIGILKNT